MISSFLTVIQSREPQTPPELVVGDTYVEFTGAQTLCDYSLNPFTSWFYTPQMVYSNGKTFLTYTTPHLTKPHGQAKILTYDDQGGFDRPINVGDIQLSSDSHVKPSIAVSNNILYVTQEILHNSPFKVYKSGPSLDYSYFTQPFSIGTDLAYANYVQENNGNYICLSRGLVNVWQIYVTKATTGFESWGSPRQVTSPPAGGVTFRHYPFLPWGFYKYNGWFYEIIACRKDVGDGGNFYRYYIWKTQDHVTYHNIEGTFSHDLDSDGILSDSILNTNYKFHEMDSDALQGGAPSVGMSSEGKIYAIVRKSDGTGIIFKRFTGSVWVDKVMTIPNVPGEGGSWEYCPYSYLTVYADYDIRVAAHVTHGAFQKPHFFKTSNQGDTWEDMGDMNPTFTDRTLFMLIPNNCLQIPENKNFPIYFLSTDPTTTNTARFICRQAAFGEIQEVPGLSIATLDISADSALNYNSTGHFDYEYIVSKMSLTGSNVNSVTDRFGLRNATGVNDPQFNGINAVTCTPASSHSLAPASVAAVVNANSFTYCTVFRVQAADSILLSFALSSSDTRFCEVICSDGGAVQMRVTNTTTHFINAQDSVIDGADHLLTVSWDGRATVLIEIDGKLQFFSTNLTDASANSVWDDIGLSSLLCAANTMNLARRDATTDVFGAKYTKRDCLLSGVLPLSKRREFNKALCTKYGITYQNQFQIPA